MNEPGNGRDGRNAVVVRLSQPDLQTVDAALRHMAGSPTVSSFLRTAGLILARSLTRAAADGGFRAGELRLDEIWIEGAISVERNP